MKRLGVSPVFAQWPATGLVTAFNFAIVGNQAEKRHVVAVSLRSLDLKDAARTRLNHGHWNAFALFAEYLRHADLAAQNTCR